MGPGGAGGVDFKEISEVYTFKLCSNCHEVLKPMLDKQHKPIHAVRRCLTMRCAQLARLLNRNVNACCNIRHCFIHENSHQGQRSDKFTRACHQHKHAVSFIPCSLFTPSIKCSNLLNNSGIRPTIPLISLQQSSALAWGLNTGRG